MWFVRIRHSSAIELQDRMSLTSLGRFPRGTAVPARTKIAEWAVLSSLDFQLSTIDFQRLRVLMIRTVMLTFCVYEEAHRRALKRPRLEFRSSRRERGCRANSERGNRHCNQQSRRGARHPACRIPRHSNARDSVERFGARGIRPASRRCLERAQSRFDLPCRIHAIVVAVFCGGVPESYSEHSPVAVAIVSRIGVAAPGARIRRKVRRLYRAFRG